MGMDAAVKDAPAEDRRASRAAGLRLVAAMLALMWLVEAIDTADNHRLDSNGIVPRNASKLPDILFAPFLHASFGHLLANSVPFLILGLVIALEGAARVLAVTAIVIVVSGLGTWLTAPASSVTVGASGVVFGYAAYLFGRGIFSRRVGQLAIAVAVGVVFGGALLWGLVPHSGISWQDHLFGALGGLLAARSLTPASERRRAKPAPAR
jgi:membrane associated rhomboid family serine protease